MIAKMASKLDCSSIVGFPDMAFFMMFSSFKAILG